MKKCTLSLTLGVVLSVFVACKGNRRYEAASSSPLSQLRIGMSYVDVLQAVGFPDTIIHLGISLDEYGAQTKIDEWWYGPDELIVLVNDTVNRIDVQARASREKIRRIIDSARAAEGMQ